METKNQIALSNFRVINLLKDILEIVNNTQYSFLKFSYVCTFQMDLGMNDLSITYDDGESSKVPQAGAGRGKKARKATQGENRPETVYEIPNVYAEIPNTDYETLQPDQGTTELPMSARPKSSASNTRPAVPGEPQHQPCCGKSARFWCLLTAALSTVIVVLLVVLLTGIDSNDMHYKVMYKSHMSKWLFSYSLTPHQHLTPYNYM